jgi:hypothetical protein
VCLGGSSHTSKERQHRLPRLKASSPSSSARPARGRTVRRRSPIGHAFPVGMPRIGRPNCRNPVVTNSVSCLRLLDSAGSEGVPGNTALQEAETGGSIHQFLWQCSRAVSNAKQELSDKERNRSRSELSQVIQAGFRPEPIAARKRNVL